MMRNHDLIDLSKDTVEDLIRCTINGQIQQAETLLKNNTNLLSNPTVEVVSFCINLDRFPESRPSPLSLKTGQALGTINKSLLAFAFYLIEIKIPNKLIEGVNCVIRHASDQHLESLSIFLLKNQLNPTAYAILKKLTKRAPSATNLNNLASALMRLGKYEDAQRLLIRAINKTDVSDDMRMNLGLCFWKTNHLIEAQKTFHKLIKSEKYQTDVLPKLLTINLQLGEWKASRNILNEINCQAKSGKRFHPFSSLYLETSNENHRLLTTSYAESFISKTNRSRHSRRIPQTKIRLGYLSADLRDHPTGRILDQIISEHNQEQFEIYVFCLNSPNCTPQYTSVKAHATHFIDLHNINDLTAINTIKRYSIDILLDTTGFQALSRPQISGAELATKKVAFHGFPGSTGGLCDYIAGDEFIFDFHGSEVLSGLAEKPFRIKRGLYPPFMCPLPSTSFDLRKVLKIGDNTKIVGTLDSPQKITDIDLISWFRCINNVADSALVLKQGSRRWTSAVASLAKAHRIGPDQLKFLPRIQKRPEFLSALSQYDLFVDSHLYGSQSAAREFLITQTPFVTLVGKRFGSRISSSINYYHGNPSDICLTREDYESAVIRLLNSPKTNPETSNQLDLKAQMKKWCYEFELDLAELHQLI